MDCPDAKIGPKPKRTTSAFLNIFFIKSVNLFTSGLLNPDNLVNKLVARETIEGQKGLFDPSLTPRNKSNICNPARE